MLTTVVNKRTSDFDIYIGRGSRWGNPYSHMEGTQAREVVATRAEAIERYRIDLWNDICTGKITLEDLSELCDKRLGCFCAPLPCHGDVLAVAAEWAKDKLTVITDPPREAR